MLARGIRLARMTRSTRAAARTAAIQRHMSSDALPDEVSTRPRLTYAEVVLRYARDYRHQFSSKKEAVYEHTSSTGQRK